MANPIRHSTRKSILPLIAFLVGACVLLCLAVLVLPPDPLSPPDTQLGQVPSFDALLGVANQSWRFLFRLDNQIIATDIYGQNNRLVLDILAATGNSFSRLLHAESLSPGGRFLAVNYFSERDDSEYWQPPIGKLLLMDLVTGTHTPIPLDLDGYVFDWTTPVHWLSSTAFLATMNRYVGDDMFSEDVSLLRFDLHDLQSVQVIDFETCILTRFFDSNTHVLLLASKCEPINARIIWAVDTEGKRYANPEEVGLFNRLDSVRYAAWMCIQGCSNEQGDTIRTERVADALDCYTRYCESNKHRHYIFLNERLVRITDGGMTTPVWDERVGLYSWTEADRTYYMDDLGHYRHWHSGTYLDKVPANITGGD